MGKTYKNFVKPDVRLPWPKPGYVIPGEKDYNRKRDKKVTFVEDEEDAGDS